MAEITIKFELSEWGKVKEFVDFHDKYLSNISTDSHKIDTSTSELEKENENCRLNDEIKRLEDENSNLKQEVQIFNEKEKEHYSELERIKNEKDKDVASLNEQIKDLKKKLAIYEPSLNGDIGDKMFFKIEGTHLKETRDDTAPFVGNKVDVEGNAIFNFNVEKGSHILYSQNISELEKFCEILDSSIDEANHIIIREWGKGKYVNGYLNMKSKAKIQLTRK